MKKISWIAPAVLIVSQLTLSYAAFGTKPPTELPAKKAAKRPATKTVSKKTQQPAPSAQPKKITRLPEKKTPTKVILNFDSSQSSVVIVNPPAGDVPLADSAREEVAVKSRKLAEPIWAPQAPQIPKDVPPHLLSSDERWLLEQASAKAATERPSRAETVVEKPLLERIYDEETGPPPAPKASVSKTSPSKSVTESVPKSESASLATPAPVASATPAPSKVTLSYDEDIPDLDADTSPFVASTPEPVFESPFVSKKIETPIIAETPKALPANVLPQNQVVEASPTPAPKPTPVAAATPSRLETAPPTMTQETRVVAPVVSSSSSTRSSLALRLGAANTKFDHISSELKNGSSTFGFAFGRSQGDWLFRGVLDLAHGLDQSVTLANTRSLSLRIDGLRMFRVSRAIDLNAGLGLGRSEFSVRSYRATQNDNIELREHFAGSGMTLAALAGGRASLSSLQDSLFAELSLEYSAHFGGSELSKFNSLNTLFSLGFDLN